MAAIGAEVLCRLVRQVVPPFLPFSTSLDQLVFSLWAAISGLNCSVTYVGHQAPLSHNISGCFSEISINRHVAIRCALNLYYTPATPLHF